MKRYRYTIALTMLVIACVAACNYQVSRGCEWKSLGGKYGTWECPR